MNNVTDIREVGKTYTIECSDGFHIVPAMVFDDIVSGKNKVSELQDSDEVIARIIQEWIETVDFKESMRNFLT